MFHEIHAENHRNVSGGCEEEESDEEKRRFERIVASFGSFITFKA